MNGVRTTFMRRGYLLTALSALLLLAASVGTAAAQGARASPSRGRPMAPWVRASTATYTVTVSGYVAPAQRC